MSTHAGRPSSSSTPTPRPGAASTISRINVVVERRPGGGPLEPDDRRRPEIGFGGVAPRHLPKRKPTALTNEEIGASTGNGQPERPRRHSPAIHPPGSTELCPTPVAPNLSHGDARSALHNTKPLRQNASRRPAPIPASPPVVPQPTERLATRRCLTCPPGWRAGRAAGVAVTARTQHRLAAIEAESEAKGAAVGGQSARSRRARRRAASNTHKQKAWGPRGSLFIGRQKTGPVGVGHHPTGAAG